MGKKVIDEFKVKPQIGRDIGIEIEMEGTGLIAGPKGWISTRDGSLRGESVEWVLEVPVAEKDAYILLDRMQTHLKEHRVNLEPSDRCGVHIHINVQDMEVEEVIKFALLYFVFEDLLVEWCGESREGNLFCLRAKDAEYILQALFEAQDRKTLKYLSGKDIRYAALNLTSLGKYGSLEFRALQTPKDFSIIKTWIGLLMALKNGCNQFKSTEEIIEAVSLRGGRVILRQIFGELAGELIALGRVNDKIIDAARRVQDVAYASRFKSKKKEGIDNFPHFYWDCLIQIHKWAKGEGYTFIKWNPWEDKLYYRRRTELPEQESAWGISDIQKENLPDEASITNFDHQHDMAFIKKMWVVAYGRPIVPEVWGLAPTDEEPPYEEEEENPDEWPDEEE